MSHGEKLPKGWRLLPIEEVAEVNPRRTPVEFQDATEVNFVPMPAVSEEFSGIDISKTRPFKEVKRGYTQFRAGDVLAAKITPCMENGKVAVVPILDPPVGYGSTEFHVLRPKNGIIPRWLAYYIIQSSFRQEARRSMTGSAGQLRVPKTWLGEQKIPVAPEHEQRRIVAKLDELFSDLDAGVAALQRAKSNLRIHCLASVRASVIGRSTREISDLDETTDIAESVGNVWKNVRQPKGWRWTSIGLLSKSMKNGIYRPKSYYADDGTPCLRMYNIQSGRIEWRDIKRIRLSRQEIDEYRMDPGDILVNRVNSRELVGKAAVIPSNIELCVFESKNIRLRVNEKAVNPEYVSYCLLVYGQKYFSRNAQQVVGMASISQSQLAGFPLPLPPLAVQNQIVRACNDSMDVANHIVKETERLITRAKMEKVSLLGTAFKDQL